MRPIPLSFVALEIGACVAILVGLFAPFVTSASGENIGMGLLIAVLVLGGSAAYVVSVFAVLLLATVKVITWRDARWPLFVAVPAFAVIALAFQRVF